jgi:hypothetical protein
MAAITSRILLWRFGAPPSERERVAALIRHHMVPFHLIELGDSRRLAIQVSQTTRCDLLAVLAEADAHG